MWMILPLSLTTRIRFLSIFGRDVFTIKNLTFEPNINIATPTNYMLGPGDQVIIDIGVLHRIPLPRKYHRMATST
jgi:hypothetical protein